MTELPLKVERWRPFTKTKCDEAGWELFARRPCIVCGKDTLRYDARYLVAIHLGCCKTYRAALSQISETESHRRSY